MFECVLVSQLGRLPGSSPRSFHVCRKDENATHTTALSDFLYFFFFLMILSYPLCHSYFSHMQLSSSQDTVNTELMEKITLLFCHLHTTLLTAAVLGRKAAEK